MNCWETLGVGQNATVGQLQIIYYNKLRQYSAMSDKEKRDELKRAYDEALNIIKCDKRDEMTNEFFIELDDLYKDFSKRISLTNWQQFIDKHYSAEEAFKMGCNLLEFLQTHKYLPHEVWKLLSEKFKWKYFRGELYTKFSKEFVDYVLKYSRKELYVDYGRIYVENSDIDYDGFIEAISNTMEAIFKGKVAEAQQYFNIAREKHPSSVDVKIIFIRYKKLKGELDRCIELCDVLLKSIPEEKVLYSIRGDAFIKKNQLEDGYNDFKKALELEPINNEDYYNMAFVCFMLRKTEEAKKYIELIADDEIYLSLSRELSKDIDRLVKESELPYILSELNKNPMNLDLYRKAYDVYYNVEEYYEAYNILNKLSKINQLDWDLYMKQANVCMKLRKLDEALLAAYNGNKLEPNSLENIVLLADILAQLNKNEEALNQYDSALSIKPYDQDVIVKKVWVLYNAGRFKEAEEYCRILDKDNQESNVPNCENLSNLIVSLLIELGNYSEAMYKCESMLIYNPTSREAWLNKIKLHNRLGKSQDVMEMMEVISSNYGDDARFIYEKASALYNMSAIDEAKGICKKLIDDEFVFYGPYYLLSKIFYKNNKLKDALKYGLMALEKSAFNVKIMLLVSKVYKASGDKENALKYVNKAIIQNPEFVGAYIERMDLYMDEGRYEEALEDVTMCLQLEESPILYLRLGMLNEKMGNNPIKFYDRAIEMDKCNIDVYLNRGVYYAKVGKHKDAFQDFDIAIQIDSSSPLPYYQKGNIYMKSGKMSEAMEEYNVAVKLGVADCEIYSRLGECYRARNNYKKSIEYCNKAIEKDRSKVDAYKTRAISFYNISEIKRALADLNVCAASNELNSSSKSSIYKYMAYCYKKLNDINNTEECFKKALEFEPNNSNLKEEYEQFLKQNSGFGKLKGIFKKN